ncbi:MAG TPA: hypothetical protein VJJ75_03345 [Candidatus Nanoarchaeia archaeon]|nr:hypothetical protein [Candidatus Nanoarchaeia archaeon]
MRNSQLFFFTFLILVVSAFYAQFLDEQAITGKIVSGNQCEVQSMKSALRKVLFAFFEDPQQKIISLSKMKDFLRFYLSVPATAVTVDCGGTGSSSGISYASIVSEAENATTTALAPKCSDGTIYGECSATKPLYCYSGNLVQRCETCGCAWSLSCSNNLCVNLTQTTNTTNQTISYRCIDTDYGQNVYVGGNTGYYKEGSADLLGGWVDRCTSNSTIIEAYCASNGSATDTIMSCPANYECRRSWNNTGDYCGIKAITNQTSQTCEDSDAAYIYNPLPNEYMIPGNVTVKDTAGAVQQVLFDLCQGNFNINEYRCKGNASTTISAVCPVNYHCQNTTAGDYCKITASASEVSGISQCRSWEQLDTYDIKFMHMMHMGMGRDQTEFAKYKDSPDWKVTQINSTAWHFELPNSQQISPACAAKKFIRISSTRVKIDYYNHCGYTVDPTATHDYSRFCDGIFPKT